MNTDDQELATRRAVVKAATCPMCGRSLEGHGGTYAQDVEKVDEPLVEDAPPSNWRKLPPLA